MKKIIMLSVDGDAGLVETVLSGAEELKSWVIDGAEEAGIFGGYDIEAIDIDEQEVLGKWPALVNEYLVFELGEDAFTLNFDEIFGLMDYVYDKPVTVCQILLKVLAAIRNMHQRAYALYNNAKEEFDQYEAERFAYYWSEEFEMNTRKTKANIEAYAKADPEFMRKKQEVLKYDQLKSSLYNARDLVEKCFTICEAFVKNGKNVVLENKHRDRSFSELADGVVAKTAALEEVG